MPLRGSTIDFNSILKSIVSKPETVSSANQFRCFFNPFQSIVGTFSIFPFRIYQNVSSSICHFKYWKINVCRSNIFSTQQLLHSITNNTKNILYIVWSPFLIVWSYSGDIMVPNCRIQPSLINMNVNNFDQPHSHLLYTPIVDQQ